MTLFEIIVSIGIFGVIICLGLIIWFLRRSITKPIQIAQEQKQQKIDTEIKQAKIQLDTYIAETRMDPKIKVSIDSNNLNKLKELRRK